MGGRGLGAGAAYSVLIIHDSLLDGRTGVGCAACAASTPASGREGGLAQCRQGTAWTHGYDQHRRMRSSTAECVSSRAIVGVQERALPLLGPEIWGDMGRCGERRGEIPASREECCRSCRLDASGLPPARESVSGSSEYAPKRSASSARVVPRGRPPSRGDIGRSGEIWGDLGRSGEIASCPSRQVEPHLPISPHISLSLSLQVEGVPRLARERASLSPSPPSKPPMCERSPQISPPLPSKLPM